MNPKRILAIHDLSGFGHTSLLAAIPIMYAMGIEVAVLPTVLLSANTDYPDYQSLETTTYMARALRHWQELGLSFDAIYSGFLGSEVQVAMLKENLPRLMKPHAITLVDPVLGDNGKLYSCYGHDMVNAMRSLLSISDIITPNFSEAAFLLEESLPENIDSALLKDWCKRLAELGPQEVIITSAPNHEYRITNEDYIFATNNENTPHPGLDPGYPLIAGDSSFIRKEETGSLHVNNMVVYYNNEISSYQEFPCDYEPVDFPGAGDCFASLFLAARLKEYSSEEAIKGCIRFLKAAFRESATIVEDKRSGIALAKALAGNPDTWFRGITIDDII
jgi:pyridoxine kinase